MAAASGASSQLLWVAETVWGTPPTTPAMFKLPFVTETLQGNRGSVESQEIRGDRQASVPTQGIPAPGGDINVEWSPNALGFFVHRALGGTVASTGSVDPYTHVIQQSADSELPSMSIEKGFTDIDQYIVYTGARISRLTFNVTPGAIVTGAIGILAREEKAAAATSIQNTTTDIAHIPLDSFTGAITEGGAAIAVVTAIDVTIDNNLAGQNVIMTKLLGALIAGRLRISGTMSAFLEDAALFNKVVNFTSSAIVLTMQNSDSKQIILDLKGVKFAGRTPQIAGEGPVIVPLEFNVFRDATAAKQIEATVVNSQADLTP